MNFIINQSTRFFNGQRQGSPYHARVTEVGAHLFDVDVVIFDRETGEPHYSFQRQVLDTQRSKKEIARAVIANPDAF